MAEKKKILLVDDDPDFVEAVRVIVESGGYDVRVAYDGQEDYRDLGRLGIGLELGAGFVPVHHRHHHVENDQIRFFLGDCFKSLGTIIGNSDIIAATGNDHPDCLNKIRIIVNQ